MLLQGRRAFVTGAAGAIGEAIAERFAAEGCAVIVADINGDAAEAVAERLREKYVKVEAMRLDVADEIAVKRAFDGMDGLDILVNNAGVTRLGSIEQWTMREWNELLGINLSSVFLCCKYAFPLLKKSNAPAIVNMASNNALVMNPDLSAYTASKGGVIALTQQLAIEGAAARIRVNCISPGLTVSEARQRERMSDPNFAFDLDCYPLGRLGYPVDVANAALFLASDLSAFVNGVNLVVDGGMSIQAVSGIVRPNLRRRWKKGVYSFEPDAVQ